MTKCRAYAWQGVCTRDTKTLNRATRRGKVGDGGGTNAKMKYSLSSGRTPVFDRRTFSVPRSTCSWRVTTYVGKPSAIGQPTRPTQPAIPSGSINWVVNHFIGCAGRAIWWVLTKLNRCGYQPLCAVCGNNLASLTLLYIVPPCVAGVANVDCAFCRQFNKRTLLLLLQSMNSDQRRDNLASCDRLVQGRGRGREQER